MLDISLVILAGRDIGNLLRLSTSLTNITQYLRQVIVVLDNSSYQNPPDHPSFNSLSNLLFLLYEGNKKQPGMRNLALKQCTASYVWFIDDDTTVLSTSASRLLDLQRFLDRSPEVAFAAGKIIESRSYTYRQVLARRPFQFFYGPLYHFGVNPSAYKGIVPFISTKSLSLPRADFVQGTNMLYRRSKLVAIGGFNELLSRGYSSFEDSQPALILSGLDYLGVYTDLICVKHHKLPRFGGNSRTVTNTKYLEAYFRNYALSLLHFVPGPVTHALSMLIFHMFYLLLNDVRYCIASPSLSRLFSIAQLLALNTLTILRLSAQRIIMRPQSTFPYR